MSGVSTTTIHATFLSQWNNRNNKYEILIFFFMRFCLDSIITLITITNNWGTLEDICRSQKWALHLTLKKIDDKYSPNDKMTSLFCISSIIKSTVNDEKILPVTIPHLIRIYLKSRNSSNIQKPNRATHKSPISFNFLPHSCKNFWKVVNFEKMKKIDKPIHTCTRICL